MLKRTLAVLAAILCSGALALTANIPLLSGPQDPSQLNATINGVIQSINSAVGRIGFGATAASTAASTAEATLQQYTMPGGLMANAGDSVRITCWGTTAANANNKTMKLYFGSTSITTATAGTNNKGWRLQMVVMRRTATTQAVDGWGIVDTTVVTPQNTDAAETLSGTVLIKCTGTNGTASASDITAQGMLVEAIR